MYEHVLMQNMNQQQRMMFLSHMSQVRKDVTVGVLLALFLGNFGVHRFYMGQVGMGILYLVFCWTGIPSIAGFVECFLMPGRVRKYNDLEAYRVATFLGIGVATPVGS